MRLINTIDAELTPDYTTKAKIDLGVRLTPSVVTNIAPADYPYEKSANHIPFAYCCGVGVDSVAGLVECKRRGIRPDLITFADTGSEKPETYRYVPILQEWLADNGFPPLAIVRLTPPKAGHKSLYDNMLRNETLPSIAFGMKSCSLRWKKEPQDAWRIRWAPISRAWATDNAVEKFIGFDATEDHRTKNGGTYDVSGDERYVVRYLLREWGLDRARCIEAIVAEGLPIPVKSACFFCPASKKEELVALEPMLQTESIRMESTFIAGKHYREPTLNKSGKRTKGTVGLGRSFTWASVLDSESV